ncbi:MAG: hypothetical protein ACE5NM_04565 [Sedimentisphaerales bacterium]
MFKFPKHVVFGHSILYRIAVVLLVWVLSGCESQSAPLPTYMRPELLYLKHQPYSRLYVEVDTIQGIKVPDRWLNELKSFLGKYCSKPDGIEIVRDQPIPISEIEDMPVGLASILCIDGPRHNSREQPAYLHVFFYDRDMGLRAKGREPHVSGFCPSGILCDIGYFRVFKGKAETFALKHEVGHLLGLCKNTAHGDGAHCRNHGCLMHKSPGLLPELGLLFGFRLEKQLCADCQRDLEMYKNEDVGSKLAFKGPFLIRREDGYSVASLPFCDLIVPASVKSVLDWKDALSYLKDKTKEAYRTPLNEGRKSKKTMWYVRGLYSPPNKDAYPEGVTDKLAILTKAANDPCPFVKSYAIEELKKLKEKQKK